MFGNSLSNCCYVRGISPQMALKTISEGLKSQVFLGDMPLEPPSAGLLHGLYTMPVATRCSHSAIAIGHFISGHIHVPCNLSICAISKLHCAN